MKTELKDVLHLYVGCEIKSTTMGIIFPYTDYNTNTRNLFENGSYTLILRPLSDMTIQEGAWCLKQTFFDHIDYPISDFKMEFVGMDKATNPRIWISNDWYNVALTFGNSTGAIWSHTDSSLKVSPVIFTYLLKQGFDLFGLIESGQAIDKTKL